jgi:hypothetical protein
MEAILPLVTRDDTRDVIKARFQDVFGVTVEEAEAAWLIWLDESG